MTVSDLENGIQNTFFRFMITANILRVNKSLTVRGQISINFVKQKTKCSQVSKNAAPVDSL